MKRKPSAEVERIQDSVSYNPDSNIKKKANIPDRGKYYDEFYARMFIDDVKLSIMPIGGRTARKQFQISLEPSDRNVEKIIESALVPGHYHSGISSEVCDFVSQCALELLLFDILTFEIVYLAEQKSGKLIGFEFVLINPFTLAQKRTSLQQVIPDQTNVKSKRTQYIDLKPDRVLTFRLPHKFLGKMDDLIESLAVLSPPTTPDFFMNELLSEAKRTPYDVKDHIHRHNVALANSTKLFGWNARLLFQDEALEYYLIHRNLIFERFKIELRDSIVKTLSEGVKRAGSKLGFTNEIVITGLPTISDVQMAFELLQKGEASFEEILGPFQGF